MPKVSNNKVKSEEKSLLRSVLSEGKSALKKVATAENFLKAGAFIKDLVLGNNLNKVASSARTDARKIYGSDRMVSSHSTVPVTFGTMHAGGSHISLDGNIRHKSGLNGVRISGTQPVCALVAVSGAADAFASIGGATVASNQLFISPDYFNGPLAAQANLYEKYRFTDITLIYETASATSVGGNYALAINPGVYGTGSGTTAAGSYAAVLQVANSISFPPWAQQVVLHQHFPPEETENDLFYVNATVGSGTTVEYRQFVQACVYGFPLANGASSYTTGIIRVQYTVELYNPMFSQGVTMTLQTDQELQLFKLLHKIYTSLKEIKIREKQAIKQKDVASYYLDVLHRKFPDVPKLDDLATLMRHTIDSESVPFLVNFPPVDVNIAYQGGEYLENGNVNVNVKNEPTVGITPDPLPVIVTAVEHTVSSSTSQTSSKGWFGSS